MILPVFLMLSLGYLSTKARLEKDEKLKNESSDIKKVLGSLTQGVALTVNFPDLVQKEMKKDAPVQPTKKEDKDVVVEDLESSNAQILHNQTKDQEDDVTTKS